MVMETWGQVSSVNNGIMNVNAYPQTHDMSASLECGQKDFDRLCMNPPLHLAFMSVSLNVRTHTQSAASLLYFI